MNFFNSGGVTRHPNGEEVELGDKRIILELLRSLEIPCEYTATVSRYVIGRVTLEGTKGTLADLLANEANPESVAVRDPASLRQAMTETGQASLLSIGERLLDVVYRVVIEDTYAIQEYIHYDKDGAVGFSRWQDYGLMYRPAMNQLFVDTLSRIPAIDSPQKLLGALSIRQEAQEDFAQKTWRITSENAHHRVIEIRPEGMVKSKLIFQLDLSTGLSRVSCSGSCGREEVSEVACISARAPGARA
jgi:hypothetical protein